MRRALRITTPENVVLSLELAGVGSRFIACLLDSLLEATGVLALVGTVVAGMAVFEQLHLRASWGSTLLLAIMVVGVFAFLSGYYIFFETKWNGQTPGKRAMGLRVMRDGGLPIDFPAAVVRNLLRPADFLPALYGIGLISILVSRDYKRLGDYVAGTLVVKERAELGAPPAPGVRPRPTYVLLEDAALRRVSELTREQYEAAKRYLERAGELESGVAKDLGERIGRPILEALEMQEPVADWSRFLEEIVAAYQERVLRWSPPVPRGP